MEPVPENRYQHKIVTIPNLLSLFRILLVPFILWACLGLHNDKLAIGLLALSALTDGVHLHHLRCPDEGAYERVCRALDRLGVLYHEE